MEEKGGREEEGPRPLGFRKRSWNGSGRDKCQKDHAQDIKEGEPSTPLHAPLFTAYVCQLDVAAR
jgi:hypothetical protein